MDWDLGCINIGTLSGTSKLGFWAKPNRALVSHSYGLCTHRVFSLGSCLTAEFSLEAIGGITENPSVCKDLSHLFFLFFLGLRKKDLATMVRTYTFAAMVAVTYVALNEADSLFGWMARRQESKVRLFSFIPSSFSPASVTHSYFVLVSFQTISY